MPGSVRIGPYRFIVEQGQVKVNEMRAKDGSANTVGYVYYHDCHIVIGHDICPEMAQVTLAHEVLHGIAHLANAAASKLTEEEWTSRVAPLLVDTLQRNPDLVAYLTEPPSG